MISKKVILLPMDKQEWKELGFPRQGASLLTMISLAEGEILNFMEKKEEVALTDIVDQLGFPEPIIMMSIGGLIRDGLVVTKRRNQFILLIV